MPLLKRLLLLTGIDPLAGATLALATASATPAINTNNVFTATLLDSSGNPLEGYLINFSTSGLHTDTGTDTTDASGEATFTLTSTYAGADTVTASVDDDPDITDSEGVTWSISFLLNDQFTDTDAAPITLPRTATPTGGETGSDASNLLSVGSGVLNVAANAGTPTVYLYDAQRARVAGLAAMWSFNPLLAGASLFWRWGWHTANNTNPTTLAMRSFSGALRVMISGATLGWDMMGALANNTSETLAIIQFSNRNEFIRLVSGSWRLVWVDYSVTTSNLYAGAGIAANATAAHTQDNYRVAILGAATTNLYAQLVGNISAGATSAARNGNSLGAFDLDTLPSDSFKVRIRKQDNSNYWEIDGASTGNYTLNEVVAGVPTQRGQALAVLVNGQKLRWTADGTTIGLYYNNTQAFTPYASASNFQNATAIEFNALGTGGALSDADIYDRYGAAGTALDANLDATAAG